MKKMPLGKLSRRQIQSAYSVLTELQAEISGERNPSRVLDASNRFYTLIPHDFGLRKPPLLDNEEIIRTKTMMLDNLLEIEVAYSLLKEEGVPAGKDPLDTHYDKLKTDIQVGGLYFHHWYSLSLPPSFHMLHLLPSVSPHMLHICHCRCCLKMGRSFPCW